MCRYGRSRDVTSGIFQESTAWLDDGDRPNVGGTLCAEASAW